MTRTATLLTLGLLLASAAYAQPARNNNGALTDAVWARDIGSAEITVDGNLDEDVWGQAETIELTEDGTQPVFLAGGGYTGRDQFAGLTPPDPVTATIHYLRKGNMLYIGAEVTDQSIGGIRDFFAGDGLIMSIVDKNNRDNIYPESGPTAQNFNGSFTDEIFYSWMNVGPNALPAGADTVGAAPIFLGNFINSDGTVMDDILEGGYQIEGVANDDYNGNASFTADTGYTMEVRIDLSKLGFDMTAAGGDHVGMTLAVYDRDFQWPTGQDNLYQGIAFFQNRWGGDMPNGTAYVWGNPDVTVASGDVPDITEPDVRLPMASSADPVVLDGQLNEPVWQNTEPQVTLQYQMSEEMLDALPGLGPYYSHWFRPGYDGNDPGSNPAVVDASTGTFRMFYDGSMLHVGLDTDDAAISGQTNNDSRYDGFRLIIRDLDPETEEGEQDASYIVGQTYPVEQFTVVVDSTGNAVLLQDAADNDAVQAAAYLKESASDPGSPSTAGDPSDIDGGYSIEMMVDLTSLGFDPSGDRLIWIGINYYDGDDLDPDANSYGMRTWWLMEGGAGPAARTYLDPSLVVATAEENGPGGAGSLRALGTFPNPTAGTATVRYELPRAATVTVEVFDVLGRQVQTVRTGLQAEGIQTTTLNASGLSAGAYVYRVRLDDGTSVTGRMLVTR